MLVPSPRLAFGAPGGAGGLNTQSSIRPSAPDANAVQHKFASPKKKLVAVTLQRDGDQVGEKDRTYIL
jgi:hypothetical protein